jgi:hypothetical protein
MVVVSDDDDDMPPPPPPKGKGKARRSVTNIDVDMEDAPSKAEMSLRAMMDIDDGECIVLSDLSCAQSKGIALSQTKSSAPHALANRARVRHRHPLPPPRQPPRLRARTTTTSRWATSSPTRSRGQRSCGSASRNRSSRRAATAGLRERSPGRRWRRTRGGTSVRGFSYILECSDKDANVAFS